MSACLFVFLLLCLLQHFISYIYRNCNRRKIKKTFELLTSFLVLSDLCASVCACVYVRVCMFDFMHFSSFAFCFSFTHENKWFMHASPPLTRYSIEILRIIDSSVVALIALCCYSFRYFFNSDYVD